MLRALRGYLDFDGRDGGGEPGDPIVQLPQLSRRQVRQRLTDDSRRGVDDGVVQIDARGCDWLTSSRQPLSLQIDPLLFQREGAPLFNDPLLFLLLAKPTFAHSLQPGGGTSAHLRERRSRRSQDQEHQGDEECPHVV